MITKQRKDLLMNIPALGKLDAMLIVRLPTHLVDYILVQISRHFFVLVYSFQGYLDNFKDQNEFWYVSKDADESEKANAKRNEDKWWLPIVKVPSDGLSEVSRKWLQFQKESVNQVLKAAMAINAQVLMEMEIPEAYIESLPKVKDGLNLLQVHYISGLH